MMKQLLTALLTVILSGQVCAFFSGHVILTPENIAKHEDFKIWLYSTKEDPDMVHLVLPFHEGGKMYWLFSCSRELTGNELNFRSVVWGANKPAPDFINGMAPITPVFDSEGKIPKGAFIRLKIRKELLRTTYIYHDYPYGVDDGGWYRTYRLAAFPIGMSDDPLMKLEWDISQYKRTGEHAKHRESEQMLRHALADEDLMAEWRRRYQPEQGAAPATAPPLESSGNETANP